MFIHNFGVAWEGDWGLGSERRGREGSEMDMRTGVENRVNRGSTLHLLSYQQERPILGSPSTPLDPSTCVDTRWPCSNHAEIPLAHDYVEVRQTGLLDV